MAIAAAQAAGTEPGLQANWHFPSPGRTLGALAPKDRFGWNEEIGNSIAWARSEAIQQGKSPDKHSPQFPFVFTEFSSAMNYASAPHPVLLPMGEGTPEWRSAIAVAFPLPWGQGEGRFPRSLRHPATFKLTSLSLCSPRLAQGPLRLQPGFGMLCPHASSPAHAARYALMQTAG